MYSWINTGLNDLHNYNRRVEMIVIVRGNLIKM